MTRKISRKLTIGERFQLFNLLPREGDLVTFKETRKLRETLNPNSEEDGEYEFEYNFRCPHTEITSGGKRFQCEFEARAKIAPYCPVHGVLCNQSGMVFWKPEMSNTEKEIWLNDLSLKIITESLRKARDDKKVNDTNFSLFEKFSIKDKDNE